MYKGSLARRAALAVVAAITVFAGLAPFAPGARAAANYQQVRYDGNDRFDTAALIASAIAEATPVAVLARADDYPDALTGAYVASNDDSPILLTQTDSIPFRTLDALADEDVDHVILLGGPAAISNGVQNQLEDSGYTTERLAGPTRYHTAMAIAESGDTLGTIEGERAALVSSAVNFPDALSGAPLSFAANLPSLLVPKDLDGPDVEEQYLNETMDTMHDLGIDRVYIVGGPAAVDESVESALVLDGFEVSRLAGANRGDTSVRVFEFGMDNGIFTNRRFGISRGDLYPDALAYAPLAGRARATVAPGSGAADTGGVANGLLLANGTCDLNVEVENFIAANSDTWTEGEILGGPNAICPELEDRVADLATAGLSNITLDTTAAAPGDTITGNISGDDVESLSVSGCGLQNENVDFDQNGDFSITIPEETTEDCQLTFTTTFTDASGRRPETQTFPIDITAPTEPDVTLSPASGPSGTTVTASLTGERAGEVTDVEENDPDCSIANEQDSGANRTFTVTGNPGSTCTITSTVTYTDGGTPTTQTFTDDFVIEGQATQTAAPTVRPELISATIGATSTEGTIITYCFDEEVTGADNPNPLAFHVYTFDGDTQYNGDDDTSPNPVIGSNNNCVDVNFELITTASGIRDRLSLATVDFDAVTDNEGSENPIGDAPLGSGQSTTLTAGTTAAPDLLSVTNCAPEPTTGQPGADTDNVAETRCTFTFDERAFTVTPAGFHLISTTGFQIDCVALPGVAGGMPEDRAVADADTTVEVECEQIPEVGPFTTANLARGFVDRGAVSDAPADQFDGGANNGTGLGQTEGCDVGANDTTAPPVGPTNCTGNINPLQATDTPDELTPGPDLVSATLVEGGTTSDSILYTFDETVQVITQPTPAAQLGRFCYYEVDGDEVCASQTPTPDDNAARGTDDRTVVVTFAEGALAQAVGASVYDDAVRDVNGVPNQEDEEGMANSNQSAIAAGRTDNPDLIGVAVQTVSDQTTTTFRATYTFDEDVDAGPTAGSEATTGAAGRFFLIASDGTRYVATACETRTIGEGTPAGTEDTDNTVHCTEFAIATATGASTGVVPTNTALMNAVLGTVDNGAVSEEFGTGTNPEGAELVTGTTGTPSQ